MIFEILYLGLFSMAASPVDATEGVIEGVVVNADDTEIPIVNAEVSAFYVDMIDEFNAFPVGSTLTDAEGNFVLPLPTGIFVLKVAAEDYVITLTDEIVVIEEGWNQLLDPVELTPL